MGPDPLDTLLLFAFSLTEDALLLPRDGLGRRSRLGVDEVPGVALVSRWEPVARREEPGVPRRAVADGSQVVAGREALVGAVDENADAEKEAAVALPWRYDFNVCAAQCNLWATPRLVI